MRRYTFVVQVHPDGISTLENLSTRERIRISDMKEIAAQIESWLATLAAATESELVEPARRRRR